MKRQIASVIGVLGLLLVAACANAQTLNVKASVPFDFMVDNVALPAGDYNIQAALNGNSKALVIRKENAGGGKIVLSNAAQSAAASPDTRLVFHRYGDSYFLSQIWTAGNSSGRQIAATPREKELARNTERSGEVIVLASLR
jgi:hypothetical protein